MSSSDTKMEPFVQDVRDIENGAFHEVQNQPVVLERSFNLFSAISAGVVTGNTWTALGGSIIASLYNGGPPGIIYEFIAVSVFYWIIAASIEELASAIPASGGVYHWATVIPGKKWGPVCGWFAGWLNYLAWTFGVSETAVSLARWLYIPGGCSILTQICRNGRYSFAI